MCAYAVDCSDHLCLILPFSTTTTTPDSARSPMLELKAILTCVGSAIVGFLATKLQWTRVPFRRSRTLLDWKRAIVYSCAAYPLPLKHPPHTHTSCFLWDRGCVVQVLGCGRRCAFSDASLPMACRYLWNGEGLAGQALLQVGARLLEFRSPHVTTHDARLPFTVVFLAACVLHGMAGDCVFSLVAEAARR